MLDPKSPISGDGINPPQAISEILVSTPQTLSSSTTYPSPGSHHLSKCPSAFPSSPPPPWSPFTSTLKAPPSPQPRSHLALLSPQRPPSLSLRRPQTLPPAPTRRALLTFVSRRGPIPLLPVGSSRRRCRRPGGGTCVQPTGQEDSSGGARRRRRLLRGRRAAATAAVRSRLRGLARPPRPGRTRGAAATARGRPCGAASFPQTSLTCLPLACPARAWVRPARPISPLALPTGAGRPSPFAEPEGRGSARLGASATRRFPPPCFWHQVSGWKAVHVGWKS